MDSIEKWQDLSKSQKVSKAVFLKKLNKRQKKLIEKNVDEIHEQVFTEVNCLDCANCCTSIPAQVSKLDRKRISNHLGLSENEFSLKYTVMDEDGDIVFKKSPCVFLGKDNHCEIYDVRPKACRQFPHTDDDQFLKNLNLHQQNVNYCPAVSNILDRLKQAIDKRK